MQNKWRQLGNLVCSEKLKQLRIPLRKWNKEIFGNIDNKIKCLEEEVEKVDMLMEAFRVSDEHLAHRLALTS